MTPAYTPSHATFNSQPGQHLIVVLPLRWAWQSFHPLQAVILFVSTHRPVLLYSFMRRPWGRSTLHDALLQRRQTRLIPGRTVVTEHAAPKPELPEPPLHIPDELQLHPSG